MELFLCPVSWWRTFFKRVAPKSWSTLRFVLCVRMVIFWPANLVERFAYSAMRSWKSLSEICACVQWRDKGGDGGWVGGGLASFQNLGWKILVSSCEVPFPSVRTFFVRMSLQGRAPECAVGKVGQMSPSLLLPLIFSEVAHREGVGGKAGLNRRLFSPFSSSFFSWAMPPATGCKWPYFNSNNASNQMQGLVLRFCSR